MVVRSGTETHKRLMLLAKEWIVLEYHTDKKDIDMDMPIYVGKPFRSIRLISPEVFVETYRGHCIYEACMAGILEQLHSNVRGNKVHRKFKELWFDYFTAPVETRGLYRRQKRVYSLKPQKAAEFFEKHVLFREDANGLTFLRTVFLKDVPIYCTDTEVWDVDKNNFYYGKTILPDVVDKKNKIVIECGGMIRPYERMDAIRSLGYRAFWLKYSKKLYFFDGTHGFTFIADLKRSSINKEMLAERKLQKSKWETWRFLKKWKDTKCSRPYKPKYYDYAESIALWDIISMPEVAPHPNRGQKERCNI